MPKGKLVGQKAPLRIRDVWAIRTRLQLQERVRDLALLTSVTRSGDRSARTVGAQIHCSGKARLMVKRPHCNSGRAGVNSNDARSRG
jgi:hypothetical protein